MAEAILTPVRVCKNCGSTERYPSGKCKPCGDAKSKAYRLAHPEQYKAIWDEWYKANRVKAIADRTEFRKKNPESERKTRLAYEERNKERIKAKAAEYRLKNKLRFKERDAKKYAEHTEKCKQYNKDWYANNPDAARVKNQNRRAKVREVGGKLTKGIAEKLFDLQKGKCPCCKRGLGKNYHLDHVVPLALGGTNTDDNVQLLRAECNLKKHAADPVEFMQSRGFLL